MVVGGGERGREERDEGMKIFVFLIYVLEF